MAGLADRLAEKGWQQVTDAERVRQKAMILAAVDAGVWVESAVDKYYPMRNSTDSDKPPSRVVGVKGVDFWRTPAAALATAAEALGLQPDRDVYLPWLRQRAQQTNDAVLHHYFKCEHKCYVHTNPCEERDRLVAEEDDALRELSEYERQAGENA